MPSLLAAATALLPVSSKTVTKSSSSSSAVGKSVNSTAKYPPQSNPNLSSSSSSSSSSVKSSLSSTSLKNSKVNTTTITNDEPRNKKRSRPTETNNSIPTSTLSNRISDKYDGIEGTKALSSTTLHLPVPSSSSSSPSSSSSSNDMIETIAPSNILSGTTVSSLYNTLHIFMETIQTFVTKLDLELCINDQIVYRNYNQHQSTKYWQHYHKTHRKIQHNIQLLQSFIHLVQQYTRRYERMLSHPSYLTSLSSSFSSSSTTTTVSSSSSTTTTTVPTVISPHKYLQQCVQVLLPLLQQLVTKYEQFCTDTLQNTHQYILYQQQGLGYANLFTVILTSLSVYFDYSLQIKNVLIPLLQDCKRMIMENNNEDMNRASQLSMNDNDDNSSSNNDSTECRTAVKTTTPATKNNNNSSSKSSTGPNTSITTGTNSTALMMETDDNLFTMD